MRLFITGALLSLSTMAQVKHRSDIYDSNTQGAHRTGKSTEHFLSEPTDSQCKEPFGCNDAPVPRNESYRYMYDKFIVEAANEFGIHPGLLKAQIHAESSFDPLKENESEKEECIKRGKRCNSSYQWGKGLGQFGKNNSARYGLNWSTPHPGNEIEMHAICDHLPRPNGKLQPIWCPRPSIWAKAKYMRESLDKEYYMKLKNSGDNPQYIRIDLLYKRNEAEQARYLAGMFNRGDMPINSIREHYRQTGQLPRWYAVSWYTPRIKSETPPDQILNKENINLCHVHKIAGLCGDEPGGWFKEYSNDFVKKPNGEWGVRNEK